MCFSRRTCSDFSPEYILFLFRVRFGLPSLRILSGLSSTNSDGEEDKRGDFVWTLLRCVFSRWVCPALFIELTTHAVVRTHLFFLRFLA